MSIGLTFDQSVPPELLRSFLSISTYSPSGPVQFGRLLSKDCHWGIWLEKDVDYHNYNNSTLAAAQIGFLRVKFAHQAFLDLYFLINLEENWIFMVTFKVYNNCIRIRFWLSWFSKVFKVKKLNPGRGAICEKKRDGQTRAPNCVFMIARAHWHQGGNQKSCIHIFWYIFQL